MGLIGKIFEKATGIETKKVNQEQFIEILDSSFLNKVTKDEEYNDILNTVKASWIKYMFKGHQELKSKDGNYRMVSYTQIYRSLSIRKRYWIFIQDMNSKICFEYSAFSGKKLKKAVESEISLYKSGIKKNAFFNSSHTPNTLSENIQEKRFCGKCGTQFSVENNFCPKCGNKVS